MLKFGNVITAMVTPFYENGNIDFDEFDSLARYLLENGSDGLLVAGTTGEGATLTNDCVFSVLPLMNTAIVL